MVAVTALFAILQELELSLPFRLELTRGLHL